MLNNVNNMLINMLITYCCFQNIPLGTLSTSEQEIANECFSGSFNAPIENFLLIVQRLSGNGVFLEVASVHSPYFPSSDRDC